MAPGATREQHDDDEEGERENDGREHLHPSWRARCREAVVLAAGAGVRRGGRVKHREPFVGRRAFRQDLIDTSCLVPSHSIHECVCAYAFGRAEAVE